MKAPHFKIWMPGLFLLAMSGSAGCFRKPPSKTKEQVLQENLEKRLERWHEEVLNSCNKRVMERASVIVDSTLVADARFKRDTSDIPYIPGRPEKPGFVPPKDSVPVQPILDSIN